MASVVLYFFSNTNFQNTDKIMINPNELRIGNYLFMPFTSENVKVTGLALKEEKTQVMYIQSKFGASQYFALPEQYSPIELTEEWLLKAGFKYKKYHPTTIGSAYVFGSGLYVSQMINNGFSLVFQTDKKSFYFEFSDRYIKYVHELQNIYFALTGVELVFTTEP